MSIAAHLGAVVTGVDISDEAIAFAQQLSLDSGIPATFERADVMNHILMIISVGLFSISELIPQEHAPPYEEVADALAGMVQRALAPAQPGDSEQGKRAFRVYLEQLADAGGERTLHAQH